MKRMRRRGNASGVSVPRKRHNYVTSNTDNQYDSNSSWNDDDVEELQQHKRNLKAFCVNIVSFLDKFQDAAMTEISSGRIAPAVVNAGLRTMGRKITDVLSRLNRSSVDETTSYDNNTTSRLLDVREADVDALYERIVRVLGPQCFLRGNGSNVASSSLAGIFETSLQSPSRIFQPSGSSPAEIFETSPQSPERIVDVSLAKSSVRSLSVDRDEESNDHGLPSFLATLTPKDKETGKWCRGCGANRSLVPTHWSDSFHRTLHRFRAAISPPAVFVARDGPATVMRTVHAANLHYHVLRVRPGRYDDTSVRGVRELVDAELGVSETGVRRSNRTAYVSVALRRRDGPATVVIGYLEVEPLTTTGSCVYALDANGCLSETRRGGRPVSYGVSRLWVAIGYRRRRVGTNMLDTFRSDHLLHVRDIAFTVHEIQLGDAFVRRYVAATSLRDGDDDEDAATVFIYTNSPAWYNLQR